MTYEEILEETVGQITRLSREWTNYNASEPGITVLEHLSAFQAAQQEKLHEVTEGQKRRLLKLAGIEPQPPDTARVLIGSDSPDRVSYSRYQKFMVGQTCYETENEVSLLGSIIGVYTESGEGLIDHTQQLKQKFPAEIPLFGSNPKAGDSLWIVMDQIPSGEEDTLIFYTELMEKYPRNPWKDTEIPDFASISFFVYTREGFQPVASVRDETAGFLKSGEISIEVGNLNVCPNTRMGGYIIKCMLTKAEYDNPPGIRALYGPLFQVCQRDTQAVLYRKKGMERIYLNSLFAEEMYIFVYGKEQKSAGDYYFYQEAGETGQQGRYYEKSNLQNEMVELRFSKEAFGYVPAQEKSCLCIVCCSRAFLQYRKLERAYGYDNQRIPLYGPKHIVKKSLCIMTEKKDGQGELRYQFFLPEETREDALIYTYEEERNEICIKDAGIYEGAQLYLCGCAGYLGEEGNVRENNIFVSLGNKENRLFQNPVEGKGGCFPESLEQMSRRLARQMKMPQSAVTAEDYEVLVKQIPGLCIHKVCAIGEKGGNAVTIVVKPYGDEAQPRLSEYYREAIYRYLEEKRLLTVRVSVKEPVYVPVDVKAAVYLHRQYSAGEREIRRLLEKELDFVNGNQAFGSTICFNEIYKKIKELPCVEHVEELSLVPRLLDAVKEEGLDLRLKKDALCCPGNIILDIGRGWWQG